jgi:hypothetical protein
MVGVDSCGGVGSGCKREVRAWKRRIERIGVDGEAVDGIGLSTFEQERKSRGFYSWRRLASAEHHGRV